MSRLRVFCQIHVLSLAHLWVTMWRRATGRLFIFRDRPLWFVAMVVEVDNAKAQPSNEFADYYRQARDELVLRLRVMEDHQDVSSPASRERFFDAIEPRRAAK